LKLKKAPRSTHGDEKDISTDLTVVPLQFPFSFSRHHVVQIFTLPHEKEHSSGCDNEHQTG